MIHQRSRPLTTNNSRAPAVTAINTQPLKTNYCITGYLPRDDPIVFSGPKKHGVIYSYLSTK